MEKLIFETEDGPSEFYVIEQTRLNATDYLLVSESPEEDAEVLIMKDVSERLAKEEDRESAESSFRDGSGKGMPFDKEKDSIYEFVTDENELMAVFRVFEELMDDSE